MSKETDTSIVKRVQWRYVASNEAAITLDVAAPIHVGVDRVEVQCKQCGNEWTATSDIVPGPCNFHETLGELLLLCAECGMQHVVPEDEIAKN